MLILCLYLSSIPLPSPAERQTPTTHKFPEDAFISQNRDCLQHSSVPLPHHFYWLAQFPLHVLLPSPPEEESNTQARNENDIKERELKST